MFERHQVVEQENTFAGEEFPDCVATSPLADGNDVTVTCVLADDVSPVSVLYDTATPAYINVRWFYKKRLATANRSRERASASVSQLFVARAWGRVDRVILSSNLINMKNVVIVSHTVCAHVGGGGPRPLVWGRG